MEFVGREAEMDEMKIRKLLNGWVLLKLVESCERFLVADQEALSKYTNLIETK